MCNKVGVVKEVVGVWMSKRKLVGVVIRVGAVPSTYWGENNTTILYKVIWLLAPIFCVIIISFDTQNLHYCTFNSHF